jgi:hypothetical protein
MKYLDEDPTVTSYEYEKVIIMYVSNVRTGSLKRYFPDFLIHYASGEDRLVEIKPSNKLAHAKVMKKTEAAKQWCSEHQCTLEVITEHELKGLGVL